ncbi:MAG TPA: radical SAM family heme chaperone HemW [Longimicrobiales bacterium]|nr:radical SAM family heme chaperone HemW [Longimicrobiales bacterium]
MSGADAACRTTLSWRGGNDPATYARDAGNIVVNPEHLYIHVPFCLRRCGYCDFAVTATRVAPVDAWLESIAGELALRQRAGGWSGLDLKTIYVGGGTPSLLGLGAMSRLRETLRRFATWSDADVEWTSEANPESFTGALAEDWVKAGINRISLGAQTFSREALEWMGRMHGPDGPGTAAHAAREAGLHNVSLDLIFALPSRLERDWAGDLDRVVALDPAHISLYGLTAEPATPLGRWVASGREALADEDRYAEEYLLATDRLGAAGFEHYEVSNFARPGRESRHNQAYWRHRPYIGLGPGAHSFEPPVRSWNVRDWAEYRRRLEQRESPEDGREELAAEDVSLERIWLGLRAADGLELSTLTASQRARAEAWTRSGLAVRSAEVVRLTRQGWLLLDRLAVELEGARG